MGNSYEFYTNGDLTDPGKQIVKHPLNKSSGRFSLSWFDIRVFYVRISNFVVDDSTPQSLTLTHIPLSLDTLLEVNGVRCLESEGIGISHTLRRDRVDRKSEEATFVSTDSVRLTGSVKFQVFDQMDLLISGVLEMSHVNGCVGESYDAVKRWSMNCESVISVGMGFLKGKQVMEPESSSLPTIEVYVAGCFSGAPVILTKTLQLVHRRKHRKGTLNSIPEYDASENGTSQHDLQVAEYRNYKPESEEESDSLYWRQAPYMETEDGELSWFNAGVRVGVGIGLGVCLGVGVGVSLLVRTYQTTARLFKRRFI